MQEGKRHSLAKLLLKRPGIVVIVVPAQEVFSGAGGWTYLLSLHSATRTAVSLVLRVDSMRDVSGVRLSIIACAVPMLAVRIRYRLQLQLIGADDSATPPSSISELRGSAVPLCYAPEQSRRRGTKGTFLSLFFFL